MDSKTKFYEQLKEEFVPLLRKEGFQGSGQNFRRVTGDLINAINIQNNKNGESCCVNMGIHFTFLPCCWNSSTYPDLNKIKEVDCEFRSRLVRDREMDSWWYFKGEGLFGSVGKNVSDLCNTFTEVGLKYFEAYNSIENVASAVTLDNVKQSQQLKIAGRLTPVRAALTMARIYEYTGNEELKRAYAEVGLQMLGNSKALKKDLEFLAK